MSTQPALISNQTNQTNQKKRGGKRPGAGRKQGFVSEQTIRVKQAKATLRELAAPHVPLAIQALADIMMNSPSDQAKVAAIKELLDRSHGKAVQAIVGDPDNPIQHAGAIEIIIRDTQG